MTDGSRRSERRLGSRDGRIAADEEGLLKALTAAPEKAENALVRFFGAPRWTTRAPAARGGA
jgi:hypothetical protein